MSFLNPREYLAVATQHALRNILDRLLLVVQASARKMLAVFGPDVVHKPGYRQALIEASIVTNAALAAYTDTAGVRRQARTMNCRRSTASTFSKPARYGCRGPAA